MKLNLIVFLIFIQLFDYFIETVDSANLPSNRFRYTRYGNVDSCGKRKRNLESRRCFRQCTNDGDCRGNKRRCLCDGECGLSCVRITQSCSKVGEFQNGRTFYNPDNYFGGYLIYECNPGYTLVGDSYRVCEGDGWWSGTSPICTKDAYCDHPPKISNAMANIQLTIDSKFKSNTEIEYQCDVGYKSNDVPNKSICETSGKWSDIKFECLKISCTKPDDIENGYLNAIDYSYSSVIEYRCNPGYRLKYGNYLRECLINGEWSGLPPTCAPINCGEPPEVPNTQMSYNSTLFGSRVFYECTNRSFVLENEVHHLDCLHNGQWSSKLPQCTERNCTNIRIPNGFIKFSNELPLSEGVFSVNTQIEFDCYKNYELIGSKFLKCLKNGQWDDGFPICEFSVYCPTPDLPDNVLLTTTKIKTDRGYPFDTVLEFTCIDGYEMHGSNRRVCNENGEWTNGAMHIKCERITTTTTSTTTTTTTTTMATTENVTLKMSRLIYNEASNRSQHKDDIVIDYANSETNCFIDDLYRNENILIDNSSITVINTNTAIATVLNNNEYLYYTCKHDSMSQFKAVCVNGTFKLDDKCEFIIVKSCPPPDKISNGYLKVGSYLNGSKAIYQCFNGFELRSGDKELICVNSVWTGKVPSCTKVNCGYPGVLDNGKIYYVGTMSEYTYQPYMTSVGQNKQIKYTCEKGFTLIGSSGSTCINGQWKPGLNTAKCVKDSLMNSKNSVAEYVGNLNGGNFLQTSDFVNSIKTKQTINEQNLKRIQLKRKKMLQNRKLRRLRKHKITSTTASTPVYTISSDDNIPKFMRYSVNDFKSIESF